MKNNRKLPNFAKLAIAIIETQLGRVIGDEAIKVLRTPLISSETDYALLTAFQSAENRFLKTYQDQPIIEAIENLPIAELPSTISAVRDFYENSDKEKVLKILEKNIGDILPRDFSGEQIVLAANAYCQILWEELIILPTVRERLIGLSSIRIEQKTTEMSNILSSIERILQLALARMDVGSAHLNITDENNQPLLLVSQNTEMTTVGHQLTSGHKVQVPTSQLRKHTVILGATGAGKSYAIRSLLDSLWKEHKIPSLYCYETWGNKSDNDAFGNLIKNGYAFLSPYTIGAYTDEPLNNFSALDAIISKFEGNDPTDRLQVVLAFDNFDRIFQVGNKHWEKHISETRLFTDLMLRARRYGVGLILASQSSHPIEMEILRNSRNLLIFRTFQKDTIEPLQNITDMTESHLDYVRRLQVGQALFYSGGYVLPTFLRISQQQKENITSSL